MSTQQPAQRSESPLDSRANQFVDELCELDPLFGSEIGQPGADAKLPDLSPAGVEAAAELNKQMLAEISELPDVDEVDRVTRAALIERLGAEADLYEANETLGNLNNIASASQGLRDIFDLMPTDSVAAWENIAKRMAGLPRALKQYQESLSLAAERGRVASTRAIGDVIAQAKSHTEADNFFQQFIRQAQSVTDAGGLLQDLERAASATSAAYGEFAEFLASDLLPQASDVDAVGLERYAPWSRYFVGADVNMAETYEWGQQQLAEITAEQERIAAQLAGPGASVAEAVAVLDADPKRKLHGAAELQEWMQRIADQAVSELGREHFDIPEQMRTIEAMIAPTQTGGIYYTPPTEDFSRPGRMWWSIPQGVEEFGTWREKTTVYHEGVPGHHLQLGYSVYLKSQLNRWRRLACWSSGHGEGWALYSEKLMASLGYLDDPGDYFGMLDAQRMRAARVVLDIGLHCGFDYPGSSRPWTYELAHEFLTANVNMAPEFIKFELHRYLSWPGQAPSYLIGQRYWEQAHKQAAAKPGFNEKDFHTRALSLGSLGLSTLLEALGE